MTNLLNEFKKNQLYKKLISDAGGGGGPGGGAEITPLSSLNLFYSIFYFQYKGVHFISIRLLPTYQERGEVHALLRELFRITWIIM